MTPELSAIVLCYRAGDSILRVIGPLYELLRSEGIRFELVLVANRWAGESDPTAEIVDVFGAEHDNVVIVSRAKQGAMGWDMRSGFDAASGEIMIVIDGDAQNPVADVVRLYRLMRETGAPVGKGRRITRYDGVYRRVISAVYNLLFHTLFRSGRLWDINGKPKGIRKDAYEQMSLRTDDWFADAEIVLEALRLGLRIVEIPVVFHRNDERASFVRVSAIWEFILHMARYRLRGAP
jgi:glycosyltransferase involved in cell wall biosynthesis